MPITPLLTKDLVLELGTVCGCTMAAGSSSVALSAALFSGPGDARFVGARATVLGAGVATADPNTAALLYAGPGPGFTPLTISSVGDASHCVLSSPAITAVTPNYNFTVYQPLKQAVLTRSPLQYNKQLSTGRATLEFSVWSADGSLRPKPGQPVWLHHPSIGDLFGGYILSVDVRNEPGDRGNGVETACHCVDWSGIMSRRNVGTYNSSYSMMTLKQVVEALVYHHADSEGFFVQSATGLVIASASYDYSSDVASALTDACGKSSAPGASYWWYCDAWKVIHVVSQTTNAAPFNLSDADGSSRDWLAQFQVTATQEKMANRVFVDGSELEEPLTEVYVGDGSKTSFTTALSVGAAPTVYVGASLQTVGVENIDTGKQWYWSPGSNSITQAAGAAPLSKGTSISITYQAVQPASAYSQYDPGVAAQATIEGGTGYHDSYISLSGQALAGKTYSALVGAITSGATSASLELGANVIAGTQILIESEYVWVVSVGTPTTSIPIVIVRAGSPSAHADGAPVTLPGMISQVAAQEAAAQSGLAVTIQGSTHRPGLDVAQMLYVDLDVFDIPATAYLIDEISLSCADNLMTWTAKMVTGPLIGDWRNAFLNLILSGGGSLISGSGGGGAEPPPSGLSFSVAQFAYGTISAENVALTSPNGVRGMAFNVAYVDELLADVFVTTGSSVDDATDPVTLTCADNPSRTTPAISLDFAVGNFVLWNDAGSYEIGQITAITGTSPTRDITIQRHYPGELVGLSTFEAPMAAHAAGTQLFIVQQYKIQPGATTGGFGVGEVPPRYDVALPAACVCAIVGAAFDDNGSYSEAVTVNVATATVPGMRTSIGGEFSFQQAGALTASAGVNRAVPFRVEFDQPVRVSAAYVGVAPTGASIKVNLRRSGDGGKTWATIEQLVIAIGALVSWPTLDPPQNRQAPYSGSWPYPVYKGGDLLSFSIEQVGSTVAGTDLTVKSST